jgi:hypothetical protein
MIHILTNALGGLVIVLILEKVLVASLHPLAKKVKQNKLFE